MHLTVRMIAVAAALATMPPCPQPAFAGRAIGEMGIYVAVETDTLVDIAVVRDLGFLELQAANPGVDVWLPGAGTRIYLPRKHLLPDAPETGIVINLADMRLYLFKEGIRNGEVLSWPIGI